MPRRRRQPSRKAFARALSAESRECTPQATSTSWSGYDRDLTDAGGTGDDMVDATVADVRGTAGGGVWAPQRRLLTTGLVLAVTLVAFEALAIATVLPVVSRHLGDLRLYGWVFSAFMLASLAGIVTSGTLADRGSLAHPMVGGLALYAVGLVIGGTAPDMPVLVAGRAVQGVGAGVVPALAYVAISRGYPERCRPRMFAVLSTAWVVPGLLGPAVASLIAAAFGWRWVFLALLPLVAVAGLLAARALGRVPFSAPAIKQRVPWLPVAGVVAGAGTVLTALSSGAWPAMAAGGIIGAVLLAFSLRPLVPVGTLAAARGLPATLLNRGLLTCFFFAGDAYVPYTIVAVRHAPVSLSALTLTVSTMTWTGGSWVQARLVGTVGPRRLVRVGEVLVLIGTATMLGVIEPALPPWFAVLSWSLAAAGIGLAYAPLSVATLDLAEPGNEGKATSGLQLCDVLGQALGTGAAGAVVAMGTGEAHRQGVVNAYTCALGVGVAALVAAGRLPARLRSSSSVI
jgi:MFS family permease